MKKFLSLVLALVMTMSLVTVSSGAAYTDADKVNYDEAIDVMSKIGVISGYEDGSINPQGTLTRGAAAKIICNLVLGPTDAASLAVTEAPYKDVPANSTFAGYIAYCKSAGYVSGYADGTFKPGATLTGYAFMKMLLGTLGLDASIEEYTGSNWAVNVAKRALNIGLDDGLEGSFNGTKSVNREEAMLFAFNALQANTYSYTNKGQNITVGGVTINTGASEANKSTTETLMSKLFDDDLVKEDVRDDFGRPATKWSYKTKKIGTYADEPKATYTTKTKLGEIYSDLGLSSTANFAYYKNGLDQVPGGYAKVAKNDKTNYYNNNGVVLEVYSNSKHDDNTLVVIDSYIGKVTEVAKDSDGERFLLTNAGGAVSGKKLYTDDFAKSDYLVMTYAPNTDDEILSAYKVEKQSGTVTKKVGTDTIYVDGTEYKSYDASATLFASLKVKDKVDFYCDQYGYIKKIDKTSSTVSTDNLAWVISDGASDRAGDFVKMIKPGDKKATTVTTDVLYNGSNNYTNKIVKYTLDDDEYELMNIGFYYGNYYDYKSGSATLKVAENMADAGRIINLDGETVFMFVDTKNEATTYTGIKNVPDFAKNGGGTVNVAVDPSDPDKAVLVVVTGVTTTTSSADLTYIIRDTESTLVVEDGKSYYTFKTLVNGKEGTIDLSATSADKVMYDDVDTTKFYDNYVVAVKTFSVSSKGVSTITEFAPAHTDGAAGIVRADAVKAPKNGVITLDTTAYALADDVAVYTVSKDGVIGTSADLDTIVDQTADQMLHYSGVLAAFNEKGKVDTIFLCSVH